MDQSNTPDRTDHLTPTDGAPRAAADLNGTAPDDLPPAPPPASGGSVNVFLYLAILAIIGLIVYKTGFDGLLRWGMVILGLGFLIFIHELGHFLAAKWCDVHVQTFSIGFGPALPGCSFTRGETTYKIAAIPLGGYVNMVGEGPEADEDENYPRSFKNKSVVQRMVIISAGVIMNVLFGAIAFVIVYRYHGMNRPPAVVWTVEPGSAAWQAGVRAGWKITELDGKPRPWFNDLQRSVALSSGGREIPFTFQALPGRPAAPDEPIQLLPVKDENNLVPVIGVAPPRSTKLWPEQARKSHSRPVLYTSAAAAARVLPLQRGEVPVAFIPEEGKPTRLAEGEQGWRELCKQMRQSEDTPFTLRIRDAGGKTREVAVPVEGFEFGDRIVGTTKPQPGAGPFDPYVVEALPLDPSHPAEKNIADPFAFRDRMRELAGKPAVIQVLRASRGKKESSAAPVSILVPPAYHYTLGMRMAMGKVAAVRQDVDAAREGKTKVEKGDVIVGASLRHDEKGPWQPLAEPLDPVRLPYDLWSRIHADAKLARAKWQVQLTVYRNVNHNSQTRVVVGPLAWDDSWKLGEEVPSSRAAPMSIPPLGIAYWVESTVAGLKKGSPADRAGIKVGDILREIRFREGGKTAEEKDRVWTKTDKMYSTRGKEELFDEWANFYQALHQIDYPTVEVRVKRGGENLKDWFEMTAEPDETWPQTQRGVLLEQDARLHKAGSLFEAVGLGLSETWRFIEHLYVSVTRVVSGRVSKETLGGPIEIASQAFSIAGEDLFVFFLFLGIISINLAVVNFLPIPVLDGGHMVFLIYEWVAGRPPSETVRAIATYLGLACILLLMLFVVALDMKKRGWWPL